MKHFGKEDNIMTHIGKEDTLEKKTHWKRRQPPEHTD